MRLLTISSALVATVSVLAAPLASDSTDYSTHAQDAIKTLLSLYDPSTGLWQKKWWNSANSLTTVADYHAINPGFSSQAIPVYEHTFKNAQTTTVTVFKRPLKGFRDSFYDDMGWWALAWTKVYDVTKNQTYLNMAESIFEAQTKGISDQCGGGIYENTARTSINAIPTELFISVAAYLANRVPAKKQTYLNYALTQWKWLSQSSLINSDGLIQDHLNASTCKVNTQVWSYNQGVILGGLAQLRTLTGDNSYYTKANDIAEKFIQKYGKNGIVAEWCSPGCDDTTVDMFKGVFMRDLGWLVKAQSDQPTTLKQSVLTNAQAVWNNARIASGMFKSQWTPNNSGSVNYDSTTAATDALVAGAVVA